jgi:hypothetical protein
MMDTDLPDETTSLMVDTQHQISRRGKQGFHKGKALAAGALLFFAVVCTSGSIYSSLDDETDEIERGFPLFGNHHKKHHHHHHSKTNDKNVSSTVSYNSIGAVEDILTMVKKLTNHHDDKDHKKEKKHKHDKKKHKPHEGDGKDVSAVVDSSNVTVSDGIVPAANSTDPEEDGTVIDGRGSIDFKGDTVNADSKNSSNSNGAGVVTDSVSSVSEGGTESKTPTNGTLPTESGSIDKPVVEDQNADSDASARSNGPGSRDDGKSSSDNKSTEGRASAIDSESSSSSSSPSQSKSVSDDTDSPDSHDETDNSNYDKSDTPGANKESDSSIDNPGSSDTSTMPSESLNNDVDDGAVSTSASGAAGDEGNGVTGNLTAVPVAVNDNAGNISDFVF